MKLLFIKAKETYNSNKYIKIGIRILISLSLIGYLLYSQDLGAITRNIVEFNLFFLFLAIIVRVIGTYLASERWRLILNTSDKKVSTNSLFALYSKGYFYNNFLPTQMGGDVYKAIAVGNIIKDQSLGFFSVFMDRFGGLIALLVLAFFGIATYLGIEWVVLAVVALIASVYLYFPILGLFAKKIKFFQKFEDASKLLIKNPVNAVLILAHSFLIQLVSFLIVYLLFLGLNITLELKDVLIYMPMTSFAILIPSFNGLGAQEAVYAFLFQNAGVTAGISIAVSVMLHVVRLIMSLIGGVLILLNIPKQ